MYRVAIDKSEIHALPSVSFAGKVVVIDSMFQLNAAIRALRQCEVVGPPLRIGVRHEWQHSIETLNLSPPPCRQTTHSAVREFPIYQSLLYTL